MAFWCTAGGVRHQHASVSDSRVCHSTGGVRTGGTITPAPAPVPAPVPVVVPPRAAYAPPPPAAPVQKSPVTPTPTAPTTPRRSFVSEDPRLTLIQGMVDIIPDGYYATQAEEGATVDFLRINRPTSGRFAKGLKLQTQHSEAWHNALVWWPSGKWSVYDSRAIPIIMLVIGDHKTCARRYGIELQACSRCTKQLTDDRSRHYLVGPECEKYRQWQIDDVDMENDGMSFEKMVRAGMPTRVWQDKVA